VFGSGGGGASDVRTSAGLDARLVVGGGGGGSPYNGGSGGAGGGETGGSGSGPSRADYKALRTIVTLAPEPSSCSTLLNARRPLRLPGRPRHRWQ
jgi:hypothetical protein